MFNCYCFFRYLPKSYTIKILMTSKDILNKIISNAEFELPLCYQYIDKLHFYEKEKGKWYLKSFDSEGREKLVFNTESNKSAPEEIVRQLFVYELIFKSTVNK